MILRFADFELDRGAYELRRKGRVVHLECIPLDLLFLLAERRGQMVARDEILERVWGKGIFLDGDASINAAVRKIRRALGDDADAPRFIITVPGKGYRFIASACKESLATSAQPAAQPEEQRPTAAIATKSDDLQIRLADTSAPKNVEGERKMVTALLADFKGSMGLSEDLDPEELRAIVDPALKLMIDVVHHYDGYVIRSTDDGIFALFGAPIAHEDHPQRALFAALRMQAEVRSYAQKLRAEKGLNLQVRVGANTGEVVMRQILTGEGRTEYAPIGQSISVAAGVQMMAAPGSIAITESVRKLVEGFFTLKSLGPARINGVSEPLEIYEVTGPGPLRTRFDLSRVRGLSRFVGRAADLRTLEDALEQTAAGNGQVVGVVAEAGAGKSRLCFEFLEHCRARGMRVYEGRAVAHGRNIPFLPIVELFRAYFGITLEDDERSAREKIAGRMLLLDQSFGEALPLLFDFLGVSDPQRPAPRLGPEARQRQLIGAIRRLIQRVTETQPTVTLVEDLHWLDAASAEFLEHMVDARAGSRSLLLVTFRPEYRAEWMHKSWYRQVPMAPLGREAIAELLADLLGKDASLAGLAGPIHARTGGNPFFIEEVAQSLIESGHLRGTRGAYRLMTPIAKLKIPATVQAVLAARIDRLADREKRLLQVASVIGKDFAEPLLAAVAELPADELKAALGTLQRAEFVHEQALYPVAEYAFKHPLIQEVALGSQLSERRHQVHAAVARAIEQQDAGHLDERAALLAHHWEEAGEATSAARWHRRAAEWVQRNNFAAAAHHWGRVRALRRELPNNREAAALGIAACGQLLNLNWRKESMGLDEVRALLEEGQSLANSIGDRRAYLYLSMVYARARGSAGDVPEYLELAIKNRRAALEIDDIAVQANASMYLVDALSFSGRLAEAIRIAEDGLARFSCQISSEDWILGCHPRSSFSLWRGYCLTWMGRLPEGLEELGRCRRFAEDDGTPEMVFYALRNTSEAYYLAHDADRALTSARQAETIGRTLGEVQNMVASVETVLGSAYLAAGRAADAIEHARAAHDAFRHVEKAHAGRAGALLAEALLQAGNLRAAQSAAEEAIALCRRSLRRLYEAVAHGVVARVLIRRDGPAARAAAEASLASAAELIERTGAKTLAPALCEWRAELAGVLGADTARGQLLREAQRGYLEIGAPGHAERLAKELNL